MIHYDNNIIIIISNWQKYRSGVNYKNEIVEIMERIMMEYNREDIKITEQCNNMIDEIRSLVWNKTINKHI
jgi:hypothetical protein